MNETEIPEFPGNATRHIKSKDEPEIEERRKLEKIVTGEIIRKKKTWLDKVTGVFFGDDAKSVGQYIVWDVLIPAAKDTIVDMVKTGVEMLVFGEGRSDRIRRDRGRSIVTRYDAMYRGRDRDRDSDRRDRGMSRNRARHKFDDIIIPSRGEAEEVLSSLVDMISQYDAVTISEFYDLVGITGDYTDQKWGWYNLADAYVDRVREGWVIVFPKPEVLD